MNKYTVIFYPLEYSFSKVQHYNENFKMLSNRILNNQVFPKNMNILTVYWQSYQLMIIFSIIDINDKLITIDYCSQATGITDMKLFVFQSSVSVLLLHKMGSIYQYSNFVNEY